MHYKIATIGKQGLTPYLLPCGYSDWFLRWKPLEMDAGVSGRRRGAFLTLGWGLMSIANRLIGFISAAGRRVLAGNKIDLRLAEQFPEMEDWETAIIEATRPFTMTSTERQWALISALKYVQQGQVAGDIVECGVWKGGNLAITGLVGQHLGQRWKVWGYDTFEGMSEPTVLDQGNFDGAPASKEFQRSQRDGYNAWCYAPLEEVRSNIRRCGVDLADYQFVKGKCEETLTRFENIPDRIAVLRLDTDWYESTKMELDVLFPRLTKYGVLIIDDYGHWSGAKRAVDEYFRDRPVLMNRIDYTARLILKL